MSHLFFLCSLQCSLDISLSVFLTVPCCPLSMFPLDVPPSQKVSSLYTHTDMVKLPSVITVVPCKHFLRLTRWMETDNVGALCFRRGMAMKLPCRYQDD